MDKFKLKEERGILLSNSKENVDSVSETIKK